MTILFQSSDSFSFDVTNGISGLQELVFHFRILPKTLYIDTRELVLTEGGSVNLATNNIRVREIFFDAYLEPFRLSIT